MPRSRIHALLVSAVAVAALGARRGTTRWSVPSSATSSRGAGVDELRGGSGSDLLRPGAGTGQVSGSKGHDTVAVQGDARWMVEDERLTRFTPSEVAVDLGSIEEGHVEGGAGDDKIVSVAFSGPVTLTGRGGGDRLTSGGGGDLLEGGDGRDHLVAGARNEVLRRKGDDTSPGGTGGDSFLSCRGFCNVLSLLSRPPRATMQPHARARRRPASR